MGSVRSSRRRPFGARKLYPIRVEMFPYGHIFHDEQRMRFRCRPHSQPAASPFAAFAMPDPASEPRFHSTRIWGVTAAPYHHPPVLFLLFTGGRKKLSRIRPAAAMPSCHVLAAWLGAA